MKIINKSLILIIAVVFINCEKNDTDPFPNLKDGLGIVIDDSIVYDYTQIDFYDFSQHMVYLKDGNTFSFKNEGIFRVYANKKEIYTGKILPSYSSTIGDKPVIMVEPSFFNDYIIDISFFQITDSAGNFVNNDPRVDPRIIEVLKKYNQFFNGLSCSIDTIYFTSDTDATVSLILTNNDNINYYYLDPDKMGKNLFHYYTNGLFTYNPDTYGWHYFFNKNSVERPEPYIRSWDINWLSLLKSKESTKIDISYNHFEPLKQGTYNMFFDFPGLSWIEKEALQQDNGRIWLGTISMNKKITIK